MNRHIIIFALIYGSMWVLVEYLEYAGIIHPLEPDVNREQMRQKGNLLRKFYRQAEEIYENRETVKRQQLIRQIRSELLREEYQRMIHLNNTEENVKYLELLNSLLH